MNPAPIDPPVLQLQNVSKVFGGTYALRDVCMDIYAGEVHCLLGDNGAGKSTLIKVMSGVHQPTHGDVLVNAETVSLRSPRVAREMGIATVHQDVGMIPLMSVSRNFFLGEEVTKGRGGVRRLDRRTMKRIALEQVKTMGISRVVAADQLVGTLSGGEKQALAIARAMYFGAKVLILDEPTSALGVKEASIVLRQVETARSRGLGVVFITHNASHALSVGDRFTVLIQGMAAATWTRGEKFRDEVLDLMAGGETIDDLFEKLESTQ